MNHIKNKKFISFVIIVYLFINCDCNYEIINIKNLNEVIQCFYLEKITYGKKEEITYELLNDQLNKTLFIQFKSIESIYIFQSNQNPSSIIFSKIKDENNFGNFYFTLKDDIKKYFIKIELIQNDLSDLDNFKIFFNSFEGKGNGFKNLKDKTQKVSSYEVINSGKFPFFIYNSLNTFTAIRINKKFEKYFSFLSFYIKGYIFNSDEIISLHINELFNKGEYEYIIWNLDYNKNKIKEIFIEIDLNIINNIEGNNIFEIELVENQEIHYEYNIQLKKSIDNEIKTKIYYINLKKYLYKQDLDILFLTNNLKNDIIISNSDNINNKNILKLNKKFIIINKFLFEKGIYKNKSPELLLIIIDENYIINNSEEIFYSFQFSGSSHHLYNYKQDITKDDLFYNNKILIKKNKCQPFFLINYFTDIENQKIIEHESILGNTNIYYSNKIDLSMSLNDYLSKINSFPIDDINNSIIKGDYGIIKIDCKNGLEKTLSYIYSYNKNSLNDIIYFLNQKALIYIEINKKYSLRLDENLKEEKFNFIVRILKKDKGDFNKLNLEIIYNNNIYRIFNENNFIEIKYNKNFNSNLNINLSNKDDYFNDSPNFLILEIIKEINIDKSLLKLQTSNIENSLFQPKKYLFLVYEQNESTQIKIIFKNYENDYVNICIHKGYGLYPYLIKPICNSSEYINLKKNEEFTLIYKNPYLSPLSNKKNNVNNENPLYISIYTDKNIKYSYIYEKYSTFNITNKYKNIDFKGKEIIQLENRENHQMVYYQINLCQNINNNLQDYSFTKPLFNYYFEEKDDSKIIDINKNLYEEYRLQSEKPKIIFKNDGILKGKFKYAYGKPNKFKYKHYSKKINIEQNKNILKISVESPFYNDIIMSVIIITSEFEKYNGYCEIIDLYENLKDSEDIIYYGQRFYQKEIHVNESNSKVNFEIESKQMLDLNRKSAKIFVINTLKEFNIDMFYNPVITYINLKDYISALEERNKRIKIIVIIIIFIVIACLLFVLCRKCQNKNSDQINYERKRIRLTDGIINESNKLYI